MNYLDQDFKQEVRLRNQRLKLIKQSRIKYQAQNKSKYSMLSNLDSSYSQKSNLNKQTPNNCTVFAEKKIPVRISFKTNKPKLNFLDFSPNGNAHLEDSYESVINYQTPSKQFQEMEFFSSKGATPVLLLKHINKHRFEEKSTKAHFHEYDLV